MNIFAKKDSTPNEASVDVQHSDFNNIPKDTLHKEQVLCSILLEYLSIVLAMEAVSICLPNQPWAAAMNDLLRLALCPV